MTRVPTRFTSGFDAEVVRAWIADDPDAATRAELTALLETATEESGEAASAALDELTDRFAGPLAFGTAGLRGAVAAGPNRMNRAVVIRAAAGLAAFLRAQVGEGFSVVIGCDARHGSHDFAHDTAAVVTAAGGRAMLLPAQLPTPVLAFATRHLDADAGVMVTASHNPPADNGYKVYLGQRPLAAISDETAAEAGSGAQIVSPADALISEQIDAVDSVASVPRAESGWEEIGDELLEAYLSSIDGLGMRAHPEGALTIVTTSLHGVGATTLAAALDRAGFSDVVAVASQEQPDPDFPTVVFPNPEEDGALDAALDAAAKAGADLIIANDPDADRVSAAVPTTDGGFRQLSGDEVGLLLGEFIAGRLADSGRIEGAVFANSIVSSRALAAAAAHHGIAHLETLTGFKWISRVPGLAFGYEEALGYCIDPAHVRDKDGISAAVAVAALASALKAASRTVEDELARIRLRDGVFRTQPLTFRLADTSLIAASMAKLRAQAPEALAGDAVVEVVDLSAGSESLAPTDGIVLRTAGGDRVIVRPSGTEPKLKCYLEAVETPGQVPLDESAGAVAEAWATAGKRLEEMSAELRSYFGL